VSEQKETDAPQNIDQEQLETSQEKSNLCAEVVEITPQLQEEELAKVREELVQANKELEVKSKRIDELARAYSGLMNDQKDFRNRLEREKERVLENERGKISLHLLQVGDEMDRALCSLGDCSENPLAQGVKMIRDGLLKTLNTLGIERLSLVGKPFDPALAEAIDLVPVEDSALDSQVTDEVAAGYRLGERLLRPAKVRVGRYVAPQPGMQDQSASPSNS